MSKPSNKFFQRRLNAALGRLGYSPSVAERAKALSEVCDISSQAARKWLNGDGLPETDKLSRLSKFLQVSIDYLMGRSKDPVEAISTDHIVVECDITAFGGDIRKGDSLVIKPFGGNITNGAVYQMESHRLRRIWLEDQESLRANFTDESGSHDEIVQGGAAVSQYLLQVLGEVVAVIRKI